MLEKRKWGYVLLRVNGKACLLPLWLNHTVDGCKLGVLTLLLGGTNSDVTEADIWGFSRTASAFAKDGL